MTTVQIIKARPSSREYGIGKTHVMGPGDSTLCGISENTYAFRYMTHAKITCTDCIIKHLENEQRSAKRAPGSKMEEEAEKPGTDPY